MEIGPRYRRPGLCHNSGSISAKIAVDSAIAILVAVTATCESSEEAAKAIVASVGQDVVLGLPIVERHCVAPDGTTRHSRNRSGIFAIRWPVMRLHGRNCSLRPSVQSSFFARIHQPVRRIVPDTTQLVYRGRIEDASLDGGGIPPGISLQAQCRGAGSVRRGHGGST